MPTKIFSEEDFVKHVPFSYHKILELIETHQDGCTWFFKEAFKSDGLPEAYNVIFNSFDNEKCRNYILSVKLELVNGSYECRLINRATDAI